MIKLIVSDLDNTLLNSQQIISPYTAEILEKCRENGVVTAFATARPIRYTNCFFKYFTPDAFICHNGAVINFPNGNISHVGIEHEKAIAFIKKLIDYSDNLEIAVEYQDKIYANFDAGKYWKGIDYNKSNLIDLAFDTADKVLVALSDAQAEDVKKFIPENCYLEKSKDGVCMVMNNEATKINAIKKLCKHLNIDISQVVAFGDDHNDLSMIKGCGIGVAVQNAREEIKAVAKDFCPSNDEDGVAKWLLENVLEG